MLIVGFALLLWARHGDGRRDLRRCPKCWYAMTDTPGRTCPECGHISGDDASLHRSKPRKWPGRAAVVVVFAGLAFILTGFSSRPWISRIPTPALRALLDLMYEVETPAAGLPTPALADLRSKKPLERARWHHTTAVAFESWISKVTTPSGPISDAELATLAPLADEANQLFSDFGGTVHNEIRLVESVTSRLARRWRAARDAQSPDPDRVIRLQWALAELQFRGGGYSHRDDWTLPPTDLVLQALSHPDPAVRIFGLDRVGRIAHVVVMEPENEAAREQLGRLVERIESVANSDVDAAVLKRARDVLIYLRMFALKPTPGG